MVKNSILLVICAGILITGFAAGCSTVVKTTTATNSSEASTVTSTAARDSITTQDSTTTAETTTAKQEHFFTVDLTSASIADHNLLGDPGAVKIYVYLPPTYFDSESTYPTVYYFHGFGEEGTYLRSARYQLDDYFAEGNKEFIMVEVAGTGLTGGSFYVNSPASGNWEDFVIDEVIPYVDANYRTIAKSDSRGLCGFSMGGFGAMNLAFLHPDVFAAVYAMSPGIMKDDALPEAMGTWNKGGGSGFLQAYARAFAPDISVDDGKYGKIPALDGTAEDNKIVAQWYAGFGNWNQKINAYLALATPLKAIGISYGRSDEYSWISTGSAYFAQLLRDNGIEPVEFAFDGFHQMPPNAITDHLGPFFNQYLVWDES